MNTYDRDTLDGMSRAQLVDIAGRVESFTLAKGITKAALIDLLAPPEDVGVAGNGESRADPARSAEGHSATPTTSATIEARTADSVRRDLRALARDLAEPLPIVQALGEVMRKVGPIAKDLRNVESRYAARSIDDVMDALHDIMAEQGVLPVPTVEDATYEDRGKQHQAILRVRWTFHGPAGDSISGVTYGEALDSSDKATNKALQASLKYLLLDTFLIPVNGNDGDADSSSPSREERTSQQQRRPSQSPQARHASAGAAEDRVLVLAAEVAKYGSPEFKAWVEEFKTPWSPADCDEIDTSLEPYRNLAAGQEQRLAAARAVLAEAEAQVTGKAMMVHGSQGETVRSGLLNDVREEACSTCGGTGPTIVTIAHEPGCPESEVL